METTTSANAGESWIHTIDLHLQDEPGTLCAYLLEGQGELALVETGPSTGRPYLEAGLAAAGYELSDLTRLIVTHIHLDHAGAAGALMRDLPEVRLSVHPRGASHMVDPSRLSASASRIFGQNMDRLWGEVVPVDEARLDIVEDGEIIHVAGRHLQVLYTPGHASHHVALFDQGSGMMFTGDVAGVRLAGTSWVDLPTPPPELDIEAWQASVDRMRSLSPSRLALTHFGVIDDVDTHLNQINPGLERVTELARDVFAHGGDRAAMTERLIQHSADGMGLRRDDHQITMLQVPNPAYMGAMGLERFLRKRGELDAAQG